MLVRFHFIKYFIWPCHVSIKLRQSPRSVRRRIEIWYLHSCRGGGHIGIWCYFSTHTGVSLSNAHLCLFFRWNNCWWRGHTLTAYKAKLHATLKWPQGGPKVADGVWKEVQLWVVGPFHQLSLIFDPPKYRREISLFGAYQFTSSSWVPDHPQKKCQHFQHLGSDPPPPNLLT